MVEYNTKTFGVVAIGVHGQELPKFAEDPSLLEYWKLRDSYNSGPTVQSHTKLMQTKKYWAKPDEIALADKSVEPPPSDPFKSIYYPKQKKEEIFTKINEINSFPSEPSETIDSPRRIQHSRWTETIQKFKDKKRIKTQESEHSETTIEKKEHEPLYSSFTADRIFVDPLFKSKTKQRLSNLIITIFSSPSKSLERKSMKPSARSYKLSKKSTKQTGILYRRGRDNLITRISLKRNLGAAHDLDIKKIVQYMIKFYIRLPLE